MLKISLKTNPGSCILLPGTHPSARISASEKGRHLIYSRGHSKEQLGRVGNFMYESDVHVPTPDKVF